MERIRKQLVELKARMTETLQARAAAYGKQNSIVNTEETAFTGSNTDLTKKQNAEITKLNTETQNRRTQAAERSKRRLKKIDSIYARLKARAEVQQTNRIAALNKKQRDGHENAHEVYDQKADPHKKQSEQSLERVEALTAATNELKLSILSYAQQFGFESELGALKGEAPDLSGGGVEKTLDELEEQLEEQKKQLNLTRIKLAKGSPGLIYFLVVFIHIGVAGWLYTVMPSSPVVFSPIVSLAVICAGLSVFFSKKNAKAFAAASEICQAVAGIGDAIEQQKDPISERLSKILMELEADQIKTICAIDEDVKKHTQEARRTATDTLADLNKRKSELVVRMTARSKTVLERIEKHFASETERIKKLYGGQLMQVKERYSSTKGKVDAETKHEIEVLSSKWRRALADFNSMGNDELCRCRERNPSWADLSSKAWKLPDTFNEEVYVGDVKVDLKKLVTDGDAEGTFSIPPSSIASLPLTLAYPLEGSLFIRAGSRKRDEAMHLLFGMVLRLLCSFPPAKAKLTIIDPVGLGQNFAALMHLADYDESLVGGKIWSDTAHIERKLTELTEHMEKVIQKFLRNRYETIDEFNKEAGDLAEPYRFLVIADFPTGFSELALDRLASIIASGVRCGVYTLILHDSRQKLPPPLSETHIRRNGPFIMEYESGFVVDHEAVTRGPFTPEEVPAAPLVDALVNGIGKQCKEAARVQVPFEAVVPQVNEQWSSSTEGGIRLPLGKAGADRLQYMHLGKGTAQHALIAGKTGSGKSNMFHVIVTNAALWYSPRELEFYMIDFKKGVEFKTYGVNQFPHGRVIAIESDREFGLSVLKRIDRELTHRGELFRRARVQDFPSYRKAAPDDVIPRTMLVIDEFQEFFTDDDGVAQEASLLLDRVVRQGRAFGIHVILGTQTLGGTYSIAKSTLGQVAVRIALQCNEADSYMILSDDNSAAALLSRPGEAIYNDMSGLVEGNNPFQAVYLEKSDQDKYLCTIQKKAAAEGYRPAEAPIVFEGNALADLRTNRVLREVAASDPQTADARARVWLGEANAIKGPTEVEFIGQAGSNLLIVGQRGDPEIAMCCATVLSLAASNAPDKARILIFDGTLPGSGAMEKLKIIAEAMPHEIEIIDARRVPQVIEELTAEVKSRQEGAGAKGSRIFVLVLGLDRFRALRQDDEFGFGGSDSGAASPAKGFGDLLTEGPSEGIHTIVWCDTLANLNRTFSRKTVKEFEARVLFQMSANDSSELIDNPAANRLGLYNALLFTSHNGAVEKFRPYTAPDSDLIKELSRALNARKASTTDDEPAKASGT